MFCNVSNRLKFVGKTYCVQKCTKMDIEKFDQSRGTLKVCTCVVHCKMLEPLCMLSLVNGIPHKITAQVKFHLHMNGHTLIVSSSGSRP